MALSSFQRARLCVYAFSIPLCIVIGAISGRLLMLRVGSQIILMITVGLDLITFLSMVGLIINTALQSLKKGPTRVISWFKFIMHMFLWGIHLVLATILIANRTAINCDEPPMKLLIFTPAGTTNLLVVFPRSLCRLHDILWLLIWVQFLAISASLAICLLDVDDWRKKVVNAWHRVTGKRQVDPTPLPRHAYPNAHSQPISGPTPRRSFILRLQGPPREAPTRVSWISARAVEPTLPDLPPLPELSPPPAVYDAPWAKAKGGATSQSRSYLDYAAPGPQSSYAQPAASSSRPPMAPLVRDAAVHAENSSRRAALANVHEPHLTPLPTRPLRERAPRPPANYRRALVNSRNQI